MKPWAWEGEGFYMWSAGSRVTPVLPRPLEGEKTVRRMERAVFAENSV